jgi:hypothetical protein
MANRKLATNNSEAFQPVCRLVSLLPESRTNSENYTEARKMAIGVVMVALLGFACMGVVFTLKHRQLRFENHQAVKVAGTATHLSSNPATPLPRPKAKPSPQLPLVQNPLVMPLDNPLVPMIPDPLSRSKRKYRRRCGARSARSRP